MRYRVWIAGALAAPLVAGSLWTALVRLGEFPAERLRPEGAASLTVLDRDGRVLRQQATAAGGRETWVPLDRLSPHLRNALVAAEDHRFFVHGGVDPLGVLRAAWLNLRARRFAFGGSTLTMQLVRILDGEARTRGIGSKLRQALAASRLERIASKGEILEQYLNRAYFGNGAWGAEAASRLYFGKPAAALAPGEAAFLAVLPRGPSVYDPYRRQAQVLERRRHILRQMEAFGFLHPSERTLAEETPLALRRERPGFHAPHFVDHALAALPPEARRGATVETTLDGPLQLRLEVAVREHLAGVGWRRVGQAGVVVLRNRDGAILAMVGSRDYLEVERDGAANVTTLRRRPGSTLKPFVYALALEHGDSPATVAFDLVLPGEARESYTAEIQQHGPARYREALAGSDNLAAVHTLARVGPRALVDRLRRAGLTTLDWPDERYGATLAIGEAEVRLVELAAAFAAFGNGGRPVRPRAIDRVSLPGAPPIAAAPATAAPIFSPEVAYLVFDMLSDPDARRPMFGSEAPMMLPFPVALKTGTTRAYTDNLALGTTAEFTVGAWAGNFDGSPMDGVMAMHGAAPLVRAAFVALAARFGPPSAPRRPPGLIEGEVCAHSGHAPGPSCPSRKRELFAAGTVPETRCPWHRRRCGRTEAVYPPEAQGWARAHGLMRPCPEEEAGRPFRIVYPSDGARFLLDPARPRAHQIPPLRAAGTAGPVEWIIDGLPADGWVPSPGPHRVEAVHASVRAEVRIWFD